MYLGKKKVVVLILLVLTLLIITIINYSKNCGYDGTCFDKQIKKCSKAKAILFSAGNEQYYEILGPKTNSCIILVKMNTISPKSSIQIKNFLEGKGMICEVPKKSLEKTLVTEVPSLSDYCTGPLKEALLQVTVEKLYEIVVKNIGSKALEYQETFTGTK